MELFWYLFKSFAFGVLAAYAIMFIIKLFVWLFAKAFSEHLNPFKKETKEKSIYNARLKMIAVSNDVLEQCIRQMNRGKIKTFVLKFLVDTFYVVGLFAAIKLVASDFFHDLESSGILSLVIIFFVGVITQDIKSKLDKRFK